MRAYDPLAVRELILNSHYRSPLDFSDAALFAAQSGYERITRTVIEVRRKRNSAPKGEADGEVGKELGQLKEKFEEAMNDDLNTAVALSAVFDLVRLANELLEDSNTTTETFSAVDDLFGQLGGDVLGIVRDEYLQMDALGSVRIDEVVNIVIKERDEARKAKDFAKADNLRASLDKAGIVLEDKPDGTEWRMK